MKIIINSFLQQTQLKRQVADNKSSFISQSITLQMKNDFKKMETEMDLLSSNTASITSFSEQINSKLHDTREKINKLSGIHTLLQKLQFLFKLPSTLKARMEEKNYIQVS